MSDDVCRAKLKRGPQSDISRGRSAPFLSPPPPEEGGTSPRARGKGVPLDSWLGEIGTGVTARSVLTRGGLTLTVKRNN